MPDVEIVIKMSEEEYNKIKENDYGFFNGRFFQMIRLGTLLPKGHGRLGDLDALKENMENGIRAGLLEEGYERYTNILDMDDCVECVEFADTIIEADKEKRDADSN